MYRVAGDGIEDPKGMGHGCRFVYKIFEVEIYLFIASKNMLENGIYIVLDN